MAYGLLGDWGKRLCDKSVKSQIINDAYLLAQFWWSSEQRKEALVLDLYMG